MVALYLYIYTYMSGCVYIYMYLCMNMYIYIYICMDTYRKRVYNRDSPDQGSMPRAPALDCRMALPSVPETKCCFELGRHAGSSTLG